MNAVMISLTCSTADYLDYDDFYVLTKVFSKSLKLISPDLDVSNHLKTLKSWL